jgi:hypothetical protein
MFTYLTLSEDKKTKMRQVLAVVIEKAFIQRHLSLFEGMGIDITHFDSALSCAIRALQSMPALKQDITVTHLRDNANMLNLLFVDGVYTFSNSTRLFSEHGTPGFGVEVARAVSTMQQFVKSQSLEKPLHSIYLAGTQEGDYDYCRECITQVNNDVEVAMLPNHGSIVMKTGDNTDYTAYIVAIGCMMGAGNKSKLFPLYSGLVEQYKLDPKGDKNVQDIKKAIVPLCTLVAVGAVVSIGLGVTCAINAGRITQLQNFLNTPEVTDTLAEYDNLKAANVELARTANDVDNVWKYVDSYPTYNRELEKVVEDCASGLAEVTIKDFSANSGTLGITTKAPNVDQIHTYIEVLKQSPVFYDVNYTGYSYDGEKDGTWTVRVECKLSDIAGKSLSNIYSDAGRANYQKETGMIVDETSEVSTEEVEQ